MSLLLPLLACSPEAGGSQREGSGAGRAPVARWSVEERPSVVLGGAAAEGAHVLHNAAHATRLSDGRIVVADGTSREVRFFGPDGRHLRSVGRQGGGPGEFNFLTWLGRIRGDSIYAYDEATRRLALFDPMGELVGTVMLSLPGTPSFPSIVGAFDDGRVLARPSFDRVFGRGERRDTVPFLIYARDGQRADTIARLAGEEMYFLASPDFSSRHTVGFGRDAFAAAAGDRAVLGSSDSLVVSLHGPSGALERRLHGTVPPTPVPADAERAWREELASQLPGPFRARLEPLMSQVPARSTYPAFAGLAVDRVGHYWMMEYPRHPTAGRRWFVYRPDGTAVATLVIPPRLELMEIGPDWILGRWRDDDGVESIQLHTLHRG